jgi:predicted dehydrogenase
MPNARPRAAIIGTGFMGRVHLEALRRLGFVDVVAVAGSSKEKARALADAFGVQHAAADYHDLLREPSVDAVHICTPNASHFPMASAALEAGKHVLCEKPLAMSSVQADELSALAVSRKLRNCVCHNLRYYPLVQQMRRMREAGDLGDILIVQGTYSQDWLFHRTDWNWRVDAAAGGALRAMGDIGSHWFDMVEHVTGLRISSLCCDLASFHSTRTRPDRSEVSVDTEDFGAVLFRLGDRARGAMTVSQVSAGSKNRLSLEIYGSKASAAWNAERPDELRIGHRDRPNETLIKDPTLLQPGAASYADLPGGHSEGYDDTFKQLFRRFYRSILDPAAPCDYPQFADGLRQMRVLDAALASHQRRAWVDL